MSNAYAPQTPKGKDLMPKIGYVPAKVALSSSNNENAAASSILLLTHDTTEIEVTAVATGAAGKWMSRAIIDSSVAASSVITAAALGANFDFVVPAGDTRRFVVPISTFNQASASVQGVNRAEGLFPGVAFKSLVGNSSILTAQF